MQVGDRYWQVEVEHGNRLDTDFPPRATKAEALADAKDRTQRMSKGERGACYVSVVEFTAVSLDEHGAPEHGAGTGEVVNV